MPQVDLYQYLNEIKSLLSENRYAATAAHSRHILVAYPRHVDTYRFLGQALLAQKKYEDAFDIYQRVLSADPLDAAARAGLATIFKSQKKLPQALEQIALACELSPYTPALRRRWEQLARDAKQPAPPTTLSRAALGMLHFRTGLYRQAVQELTAVAHAQPERMDVRIVLAEAYWRLDKKVEAAAVCEQILEKLPHCIKANAILAEVWLRTGRMAGARRPLQLLQGLLLPTQTTCDADTPEGRAFLTKGSLSIPKQIELTYLQKEVREDDLLVHDDDEVWNQPTAFGDTGYLSLDSDDDAAEVEVDFFAMLESGGEGGGLFAFDADEEAAVEQDWLAQDEADEDEPAETFDFLSNTRTPAAPTAVDDDDDVPDWLAEMDTGPLNKQKAADVPEWISDTNERAPLLDNDRPAWLAEVEEMADDDLASNLFMSDDELAMLSTDYEEEQSGFAADEDDFDFLSDSKSSPTAEPLTASMDVNAFLAESSGGDDLPDWLSNLDSDEDASPRPSVPTPIPTTSTADNDDFSFLDEPTTEETNDDWLTGAADAPASAMPDWMQQELAAIPTTAEAMFLADEEEEEELAAVPQRPASYGDLPDWLQDPVELSPADAVVPRATAESWLDKGEEGLMATPDENDEFAEFLDESKAQQRPVSPVGDSQPDWLNMFAADGEPAEAEESDTLPDWLSDVAPTEDLSLQTGTGLTSWLSEHAPEETAAETSADDFPDWLSADLPTAEPEAEPEASTGLTGWLTDNGLEETAAETSADDFPDWLSADLPTAEPEAEAETSTGLTGWLSEHAPEETAAETSADDFPDWLSADLPTAEPEAEAEDETSTGLTGWLTDNALEETAAETLADDFPDWLSADLSTAEPEAEAETSTGLTGWLTDNALEETAAETSADDFPDWLSAELPTAEPEAEAETSTGLTGWLTDNGLEETAAETEEDEELPDWLSVDLPQTEGHTGLTGWLTEPEPEEFAADDTADELPDWLGSALPVTESNFEMAADWLSEPSPFEESQEDTANWLSDPPAVEEVVVDELPVPAPELDLDAWLSDPEPSPAAVDDDVADELAWLNQMAAQQDTSAVQELESSAWLAASLTTDMPDEPDLADLDIDFLGADVADERVVEEESTAVEDPQLATNWADFEALDLEEAETTTAEIADDDSLPDWLTGVNKVLATPDLPHLTLADDMPEATVWETNEEGDEPLPDWLTQPTAATITDEETAAEADVPTIDELDWLGDAELTLETADDEEPDDLLAAEPEPEPLDTAENEIDWLTADPLQLDDDDFAAQLIERAGDETDAADLSWLLPTEPEVQLPDDALLAALVAEPEPTPTGPIPDLLVDQDSAVDWADDPLALDVAELAAEQDTADESPEWLEEWTELEHSGTAADPLPELAELAADSHSQTAADPDIPDWLLDVPEDEPFIPPVAPAKAVVPQLNSLEETLAWLEQIALDDD